MDFPPLPFYRGVLGQKNHSKLKGLLIRCIWGSYGFERLGKAEAIMIISFTKELAESKRAVVGRLILGPLQWLLNTC